MKLIIYLYVETIEKQKILLFITKWKQLSQILDGLGEVQVRVQETPNQANYCHNFFKT